MSKLLLEACKQGIVAVDELCHDQDPQNECWNILNQLKHAVEAAEATTLGEEFSALLARGLTQGEVLNILAQQNPGHWAVGYAREETDDELEIDDTPLISEADGGAWVSAWVWVPRPEEQAAG